MSRRKEPAIANALLDQLLAGGAASAASEQGGLLDALKKALTERALNAEMDHHLAGDDGAGKLSNHPGVYRGVCDLLVAGEFSYLRATDNSHFRKRRNADLGLLALSAHPDACRLQLAIKRHK